MKIIYTTLIGLLLAASVLAEGGAPLTPFTVLEKTARARTAAKPRLPLASAAELKPPANADALESGNVPNYILALGKNAKASSAYGQMVQTFIYGGTVQPETKMAMGLRIAQIINSPYLFAHATRWLRASDRGRTMLKSFQADQTNGLPESDRLAVNFADLLTRDIHGISDAEFARVRSTYNDSQIVELTLTVCFFNQFVRLAEALNLPVETWAIDDAARTPERLAAFTPTATRVALISDDEMTATGLAVAAAKEAQKPGAGLGLGVANSMRAMMRVPALAKAWRDFGFQSRETWSIDRNIQLQVSFAVSNANGCRYCTLHQVLGLRRLGVDVKKLVAMKKEDSTLTPRELVAVEFARKLTTDPSGVSDADMMKLKNEFGEQGSLEVVLQTGAFAFMNRFTDNLGLPSEDEAVRVYQETYGDGTYKSDWKR